MGRSEQPAALVRGRLRLALRHLALPAVFIVGPVTGLVLIEAIFGLPPVLWYAAGPYLLLGLAMLGLLLRGEYQRLTARAGERNRPS